MNVTEMANSTAVTTIATPVVTEGDAKALTTVSSYGSTTGNHEMTTVIPPGSDSAVIAVVVMVILLTLAALAFLLYRYLCHNKGAYRTTGELAPGEDFEEELHSKPLKEKKEYFI